MCPNFIAFLKSNSLSWNIAWNLYRYWFQTRWKYPGCSWAQEFLFLTDNINNTVLFYTLSRWSLWHTGVTNQTNNSPGKIQLKTLKNKSEFFTYHFGKKDVLPSFLFISWLSLLTMLFKRITEIVLKKKVLVTCSHFLSCFPPILSQFLVNEMWLGFIIYYVVGILNFSSYCKATLLHIEEGRACNLAVEYWTCLHGEKPVLLDWI